jgi:hypothetical protein
MTEKAPTEETNSKRRTDPAPLTEHPVGPVAEAAHATRADAGRTARRSGQDKSPHCLTARHLGPSPGSLDLGSTKG